VAKTATGWTVSTPADGTLLQSVACYRTASALEREAVLRDDLRHCDTCGELIPRGTPYRSGWTTLAMLADLLEVRVAVL